MGRSKTAWHNQLCLFHNVYCRGEVRYLRLGAVFALSSRTIGSPASRLPNRAGEEICSHRDTRTAPKLTVDQLNGAETTPARQCLLHNARPASNSPLISRPIRWSAHLALVSSRSIAYCKLPITSMRIRMMMSERRKDFFRQIWKESPLTYAVLVFSLGFCGAAVALDIFTLFGKTTFLFGKYLMGFAAMIGGTIGMWKKDKNERAI